MQNGASGITRREKEVLKLIVEGLINKEISEKLFISTTTVDTHRNSLLSKSDVKNTANRLKLRAQIDLNFSCIHGFRYIADERLDSGNQD